MKQSFPRTNRQWKLCSKLSTYWEEFASIEINSLMTNKAWRYDKKEVKKIAW